MTTGTAEIFQPAWWLSGGHPQTLYRKFAPINQVIQIRQRVELEDGDFVDLDWAKIKPDPENAPTIVVMLHGLCGCSASSYIQSMQTELSNHGICSVAVNFRGCSGEVNRLARAYHSGVSEDVDAIFKELLAQYPNSRFSFIGYSLGANVLLKWLGQSHYEQIDSAVAVSTPFSLAQCSKAMLKGTSKWYGLYFLRKLVNDFQLKKQHFKNSGATKEFATLDALGPLEDLRSIWEFDDRITAPLHGFRDADDYYERSSSSQFLPQINTPTLLIQSRDDPLIPEQAIPVAHILPKQVQLRVSARGGHVGFIAGRRNNWLENTILRYFQSD